MIYYDDDDCDHLWILLRSTSNTLQAWNQSECKLHGSISLNHVFEKLGKTDEQLSMLEGLTQTDSNEDDGSSNHTNDHIRITSILIHDHQIWIGTSTGIILVFNFTFQRKFSSIRAIPTMSQPIPRSYSVTSHMIDESARRYLSPLADLMNNNRKKSRSQSESAMIDLYHSSDDCWSPTYSSNRHLYRIVFPAQSKDRLTNFSRRRKRRHSTVNDPIIEDQKLPNRHSDDSSTTITSVKTRSSSPAVISSDEYCQKHRQIKFPSTTIKQQKSLDTSGTFALNLLFKAKISDAPVKCICKTK